MKIYPLKIINLINGISIDYKESMELRIIFICPPVTAYKEKGGQMTNNSVSCSLVN